METDALRLKALYRVTEVAEVLSVGRTKVYELINSGQLDAAKVGRATRVTRSSIVRFLSELNTDDRREHR